MVGGLFTMKGLMPLHYFPSGQIFGFAGGRMTVIVVVTVIAVRRMERPDAPRGEFAPLRHCDGGQCIDSLSNKFRVSNRYSSITEIQAPLIHKSLQRSGGLNEDAAKNFLDGGTDGDGVDGNAGRSGCPRCSNKAFSPVSGVAGGPVDRAWRGHMSPSLLNWRIADIRRCLCTVLYKAPTSLMKIGRQPLPKRFRASRINLWSSRHRTKGTSCP